MSVDYSDVIKTVLGAASQVGSELLPAMATGNLTAVATKSVDLFVKQLDAPAGKQPEPPGEQYPSVSREELRAAMTYLQENHPAFFDYILKELVYKK